MEILEESEVPRGAFPRRGQRIVGNPGWLDFASCGRRVRVRR